MSDHWSKHEVAVIVADYFEMLRSELLELPYNKTDHRTALISALQARSHGSVEFKHQNISAVLRKLGLPYIDGYKPRDNYQRMLADAVINFLDSRPDLMEELSASRRLNPAASLDPS